MVWSPKSTMVSSDAAILSGVRALWDEGYLYDLTVCVEDGIYYQAHKVILASISNYFCSLLTSTGVANNSHMDDGASSTYSATDSGNTNVSGSRNNLEETGLAGHCTMINLPGVSAMAMDQVLSFIYKNSLDVTKENVKEVFTTSVLLQMPVVTDACVQFMIDTLDAGNCCSLLLMFEEHGLIEETKCVRSFIKDNIEEVVKIVDLQLIGLAEINLFIRKWTGSEFGLFECLLRWVEAHFETRRHYLNDLFSRVRYCLMSPQEIEKVKGTQVYKENFGLWHTLVKSAMEHHALPMHRKVLNDSVQNSVRGDPAPTCITGRYGPREIYTLDQRNQWHKCKTVVPNGEFYYYAEASIAVNNFLIVKTTNFCEWCIFDPRMMIWDTLTPGIVEKDVGFAVVHNGRNLYVIGGSGPDYSDPKRPQLCYGTIERYDFNSNRWSLFVDLPSSLEHHAACVHDNMLYISGGCTGITNEWTDKFMCMDLDTPVWEERTALREKMAYHVMSVMKFKGDDVIFVLDNHFKVDYYNLASDQWCELTCSFVSSPDSNPQCDNKTQNPINKIMTTKNYCNTGHIIVHKNTIFFSDIEDEGKWRNGGICFKLTLPENGNEACVKYLRSPGSELFGAFLSVPSDKMPPAMVEFT